ncbi:MAG: branched-chain amino acid aminotransferase [Flavobacteriia bacterium]|nr:branched-chain amino acid aminotransferase [Flavobacteriia bacterium]
MSRYNTPLSIETAAVSKIDQVDFSNLAFGNIFSDHMLVCDFKNGAWEIPKIMPYQNISIAPSARVFHYGQAIFEGMKAYKDNSGDAWLFRPEENFKRFNTSCVRMAMPEIREDYFFDGLHELLKLDQNWIKSGAGNSLYIRPFMIASEAGVSASPAAEYTFMIICSPAQAYYGGEVRVKIAEKFSRAAPGGFGYAKAAGNYAGQFYPTKLAQEEGFQQLIWTDAKTHEYIEEAGVMNIFVRIGDTLVTGPTSDSILDGVTRKSIIQLAEDNGYHIEVRPLKVQEILDAHKNGSLKEMFGAGTAAVVSPISGFGYQGAKYELPTIEDSYAMQFKKKLNDIQYNLAPDPYGWRVAAW